MSMAEEIRRRAEELWPTIVQDRRYLHQIPEIGMDLPQTCAYLKKRLDEMGIPWQVCGGPLPPQMTADYMAAGFPEMKRAEGITALIGSGAPCILLRADMDALPIREENDLPFRAQNGYGHMCGHDSHAAMLLGAAQILKEREDRLPGTVKLLFQPGEETGAGARMMVDCGALENPKVDAAFALHVQPLEEAGRLRYSMGVTSASLDTYIIKIKGKGGHSSIPQCCIDPLMIANQVYQAVNLLVGRETNPAAMVALTCGVMRGGSAVNIIPDQAELHIGVRTLDMGAAEHLARRIPELTEHYVRAWRGDVRITEFHTPCTYSREPLCRELAEALGQIVGPERMAVIPPMTGTEDFGYITREVPGMFCFLGAGAPGSPPLHSPNMVLDERVLSLGAALYANAAAAWLARRQNSGEEEGT